MSGSKLSEKSFRGADQPLDFTVHSMPTPEQSVAGDSRRRIGGRLRMLLVMLVCAAPVVASYMTFYVIRPESRRSYGVLIEPQRPLPARVAQKLDGGSVNLRDLKGQWLLMSVAGGQCSEACARHLYLQRQLREGLGKEKDRVDWVWLVSDDAPVPAAIVPALQSATVLRLPGQQIAQWLTPAEGHALDEHLFVVDPQGNWMMRFPPGLTVEDAPKVKRDLERLLRASASWDQPGRESAR